MGDYTSRRTILIYDFYVIVGRVRIILQSSILPRQIHKEHFHRYSQEPTVGDIQGARWLILQLARQSQA